jgi:multiple sugar transport system substrate-binding protein
MERSSTRGSLPATAGARGTGTVAAAQGMDAGGAGGAGGARPATRRRLALSVALIGAGGGALAACVTGGQTPAESPSAKEVTITYVSDWSASPRSDWINAALPRFTQEYPKIKVQADNWAGEVSQVALANAAAGTLQDVMLGANDVFIQLARSGGMQDIAPVLKSLKVNMNDLVHVPSTHTYKGKQYGMPFQFIVQAMVINKTLFKNASVPLPTDKTTYPELLEALRKVARPADNIHGLQAGAGAGSWGQWLPMVWGYGGDRWTPDFKRTLLDQAGSMEGLQFFVDMMQRHGAAVPIDEKGAYPSGVGFAAGNVAVGFAVSPGTALDRQVGGKFEWDLMHHPIGPKVNKRDVFVNDQCNTVTAPAVKRGVFEQAVQFAVWCAASKTAQDLIVEIGPGVMPVSKAVIASPKYLAGPPASQKIVQDMTPAFRDPEIFIGWNEWRDEVYKALLPAFAGKKSVQDAAKDATRAGDVVLAKIPA